MITRHAALSFLGSLKIVLSAMVLVAFTQGCSTKLKPIQDFANLSVESAQYTTLVDDYLEFPNRQKRYQPSSRHANLDAMAKDRATQKSALLLRQSIIETYMEALGRLAADEVVDNTEELANLSAALEAHAATNPQEAKAFKKIAGMVTTVVVKRWRQHQLRELIEQSNPPIQQILGTLHRIVSDGFGGDLQTEETAIQNYYMTLTMESQDPAGKAALAEWKDFRLSQVHERSEAVQTYGKILDNISSGHQRLFDQRQNLTKKEVLQQVGDSVKDLRSLLETIKKL
ncbi:MAG TPA: hypothetical protein PKK23_02650 [Nitrospirales bacterium]|nr:hypothetical protein [Nitrospiraceae bacterium]HNP27916.1 hypothetical protein [Nitrospirales bacterium]